MPSAVVTANRRKSVPPTIPITFSETYLATMDPLDTAMPVAKAWAATPPTATLKGFWEADRAMVDKKTSIAKLGSKHQTKK